MKERLPVIGLMLGDMTGHSGFFGEMNVIPGASR
jgi:hypothetical protein